MLSFFMEQCTAQYEERIFKMLHRATLHEQSVHLSAIIYATR